MYLAIILLILFSFQQTEKVALVFGPEPDRVVIIKRSEAEKLYREVKKGSLVGPIYTKEENERLFAVLTAALNTQTPKPVTAKTERVNCTVVHFSPDGYVALKCKEALIQYQCGHWPEAWIDGPVFSGTYKADLVKIPLSERLIDGALDEGQSLQLDGKLVPVTSRSPKVKVPVEIVETISEQQWRCGGPLIPLINPEGKNAN